MREKAIYKPNYTFTDGIKDGIPIALGYLSVSFSFGLLAVNMGIPAFFTVFMSFTNLTSAGQFAGIGLISAGATLLEMMFTQFVINIRYSLMSISISQKVDKSVNFLNKLLISFFITDEIFAVATSKEKEIGHKYLYGLGLMPLIGWTLGTLLGAVCGNFLPTTVRLALGVALYAMFIAIVVPEVRKSKAIGVVVTIAVTLSCIFKFVPYLKHISGGFAMIISAIIASVIGAIVFPIEEVQNDNN